MANALKSEFEAIKICRRIKSLVDNGKTICNPLDIELRVDLLLFSRLFDLTYIRNRYPHIAKLDNRTIALHVAQHMVSENLWPSSGFDPHWYMHSLSILQSPAIDDCPLIDYILKTTVFVNYRLITGNPNKYFNSAWHKPLISDSLRLTTPLESYLNREDCDTIPDPSDNFNHSLFSYCNHLLEKSNRKLNPLTTFLHSAETVSDQSVTYSPSTGFFGRLGKCSVVTQSLFLGNDVILLTLFIPGQHLSSLQKEMIGIYKQCGYTVVAILNMRDISVSEIAYQDCLQADYIISRENIGFDFGAWRAASWMLPNLSSAKSLSFTNDSIFPLSPEYLSDIKSQCASSDSILFLTQNTQIRPHFQTYFISVPGKLIYRTLLSYFSSQPWISSKQVLIDRIELNTVSHFRELDLPCRILFRVPEAEANHQNPTIDFWERLLNQRYPFIKITLFTDGNRSLDDHQFTGYFNNETCHKIKEHLEERLASNAPPNSSRISTIDYNNHYYYTGLTNQSLNEYGARNAWNPMGNVWPKVLLRPSSVINQPRSITAIVHCFYIDVAERILERLAICNSIFTSIVCTTDTQSKVILLKQIESRLNLSLSIKLVENRGRDIAPFLINCREEIMNSDIVLHMHTKKSPHDKVYQSWLPWLMNNLIRDEAHIRSIVNMLISNRSLGIVYSEHFPAVAGFRNWGYDFDNASALLKDRQININPDNILEFPTSSMFWAKSEAIAPLVEKQFTLDQFPEEAGQIDGTLAHAIERSFLYVAESKGFYSCPITTNPGPNVITYHNNLHIPSTRYCSLLGNRISSSSEKLLLSRSNSKKTRINLLIPTLNKEKIYGGISTAIKLFHEITQPLLDAIDLRVIITTESLKFESLATVLPDHFDSFYYTSAENSDEGNCIIDISTDQLSLLPVRESDIFMATAWWTAGLAHDIYCRQQNMFSTAPKYIYFIQDYEPGFYPWSDEKAFAEATYAYSNEFNPIINSEELANYFSSSYKLSALRCIPFSINASLECDPKLVKKRNQILVYARPSTPRNLFTTAVKSIYVFQQKYPEIASKYQILLAGESINSSLVATISNVRICGKLSLAEYSNVLSESKIGLSLMMSPHPSYPPLEMAYYGAHTITNRYQSKDLEFRSKLIISIGDISPLAIGDMLGNLGKKLLESDSGFIANKIDSIPLDSGEYIDSSSYLAEMYNNLISH